MTAHDLALQPRKSLGNSNQVLLERAAKCHSRQSEGFQAAEKAAVKLLQRATSAHAKADEARKLLRTLTHDQRKLYDLPTFLFEDEANA